MRVIPALCHFSSSDLSSTASPRQTEENEDEEQSDKSIRDIVDLQEMDFTVRVQAPGADCLELQVLLCPTLHHGTGLLMALLQSAQNQT